MLKVIGDSKRLDAVQSAAEAVADILNDRKVPPGDAMMALCIVLSQIVETCIETENWHKALADIHNAIAANINSESEDEPDHGSVN